MKRIRVLIADDNPLGLRFFSDALAALESDCVAVVDGVDAVDHAERSHFDLLLFDARMPRLDGIGALQCVRRSMGPSRDALALATTASGDGETHAALRAAGFAEVLTKPLSIVDLHAAITRWFDDPSASIPDNGNAERLLAEDVALAAAGGDTAIVAALRGLFRNELDILPAEIGQFAGKQDRDGLRERLHRLDASAGFCGAPTIARAAARVRAALDGSGWPRVEVDALINACERVRMALDD